MHIPQIIGAAALLVFIGAACSKKSGEPIVSSTEKPVTTCVGAPDSVQLVFIKSTGGCHACSVMTRCVLRVMDQQFTTEKNSGKLSFEVVTLADTVQLRRAQHFGGRVKTLAVARWQGGREVDYVKVDSLLEFGDDTVSLENHVVKRIRTIMENR